MSIFDLFKQIEKKEGSVLPVSYIIAGLGNPGAEYEKTRHNTGFIAIDALASKYGTEIKKAKFSALVGEAVISGKRVLLMKPQTYMNLSGNAVAEAAAFYKITPENVLVLSDDVNLDVGKIRIRKKGSDGGQKGLRSIIAQLGSDGFPRLRIGVGKLPQGGDMVSWVLGRIPSDLADDFSHAVTNAVEAVPLIVNGEFDAAMTRFN